MLLSWRPNTRSHSWEAVRSLGRSRPVSNPRSFEEVDEIFRRDVASESAAVLHLRRMTAHASERRIEVAATCLQGRNAIGKTCARECCGSARRGDARDFRRHSLEEVVAPYQGVASPVVSPSGGERYSEGREPLQVPDDDGRIDEPSIGQPNATDTTPTRWKRLPAAATMSVMRAHCSSRDARRFRCV